MSEHTKLIIKHIALMLCIILIVILWIFIFNYRNAKIDEYNTIFNINVPSPKREAKPVRKMQSPQKKEPTLRDENNMPKTDIQVPEIG